MSNAGASAEALVAFLAKYQYIAHAHVNDALTRGILTSLFDPPSSPPSTSSSSCSNLDGPSSLDLCQQVMAAAFHNDQQQQADPPASAARGLVSRVFRPADSGDSGRDVAPPSSRDAALEAFVESARQLVVTNLLGGRAPAPTLSPPPLPRPNLKPDKVNATTGVKKSHEVERMAPFVHARITEWLAVHPHSTAADVIIVDIGAGQGYLTCELAAAYGYRAVAVERDGIQQHGAKRRSATAFGGPSSTNAAENKKEEGNGGEKGSGGSVTILSMDVDKATSASDFEGRVLAAVPRRDSDSAAAVFVLVSLHACGSLSANMLRLFTESARCVLVVNVGCCYNLIEQGDFPMSSLVKDACSRHRPSFAGRCCSSELPEGSPLTLSKNMLMAACQAPQRWLDTQVGGQGEGGDNDEGDGEKLERSLHANAMRTTLQLLLKSTLMCDDLERIGRVPFGRKRSRSLETQPGEADEATVFWEYAVNAVRRVMNKADEAERAGLPSEAAVEQEARRLAAMHLASGSPTLRQLALMWAAKAITGSTIEGLILHDRQLFLQERSARCELVRLFDPRVSPRFVAVVAHKK